MTDELISKFDELIHALSLGKAALWTPEQIAAYLNISSRTAREKVICRPDFPSAIRLTEDAKGRRWQPEEVIEWAKRQRDMPRARRRAA